MAGAPQILSFSLAKLRQLQRCFDDVEAGADERAARRLAAELGGTALPLLLREIVATHDGRRRLAHALLAQQAAHPERRERMIDELCSVVSAVEIEDAGKLRALSLLTELGVRPPGVTSLRDPDAARERSLGELAGCLTSPAEVAKATDHLLSELGPGDLETFVTDLARAEPIPAGLLIDELLVRDDLPEVARKALLDLRAATGARGPLAGLVPSRRRPIARLGRHRDGRRILVVSARGDGKPPRRRAMCALLSPDGRLIDGHHVDDLAPGDLDRAVIEPLVGQGFAFVELGLNAARGCLIQAARSALVGGLTLPRDFYLGRDLIGLRDEHLDGTGRRAEAAELDALGARAAALLRSGEHADARPLLERLVAASPGDPDGHAHLGLCLLGLGDPTAAGRHLGRAAFLCPDEPLYQWNLAAAAHRADDLVACYQALKHYLRGRDIAPDREARRAHAARFVAEFERLRDLDQPAAPARAARRRARRATGRRRTSRR